MLKISLVENRTCCLLVLEGKLIAPWTVELRAACEKARAQFRDRELVVDLKHITAISQEGENVLYELMNKEVKLRGRGVFTKQVLRQVAHRVRRNIWEAKR